MDKMRCKMKIGSIVQSITKYTDTEVLEAHAKRFNAGKRRTDLSYSKSFQLQEAAVEELNGLFNFS